MSLLAQPPNAELCASKISPARTLARRGGAARAYAGLLLSVSCLFLASACSKSNDSAPPSELGGAFASGGSAVAGAPVSAGGMTSSVAGMPSIITGPECVKKTCADLGWACGYTVDKCGNVIDCAQEGLTCN
ncbi:MAG TPA: hypothetical protein VGJ91_05505, partial [Polyangiaceae bacterium]